MNRRTFLAASTALLARGADTDPEASVRARIKPPEFPNRDFEVTKYGARGDGSMLCTDAIHKAIAACSEAGGGRVIIPSGVFLTGAIHLKTGVNLQFPKAQRSASAATRNITCRPSILVGKVLSA